MDQISLKAGLKLFYKIVCFLCIAFFSSCSAFYTRHYTKGFYYEAFAKKHHTDQLHIAEPAVFANKTPKDTLVEKSNVKTTCIPQPHKLPSTLTGDVHFLKREKKAIVSGKKVTNETIIPAKQSLQKTQRSGSSSNSSAGTVLLYILAIMLALGIIALAIYFLPAILIPTPVFDAFITLVVIVAIIVLVILAMIIYSLIIRLIELFKRKKPKSEDDF